MKSNLFVLTTLLVVLTACKKDKTDPPFSEFTCNDQALIGETLQFTSQCKNFESVLWDFGDSTTSTEINPVHSYSQRGEYVVKLKAVNDAGDAVSTRTIIIVQPYPVADFSAKSSAYLTEPVTFTSHCQNADTVTWDFGDGLTGTGSVATHIYNVPGTYNIKVTAKNFSGTDNYSQAIQVKEGKSEYNAVNASSFDATLLSFYGGAGTFQDPVELGYIVAGDSSDYYATNRESLYLGGSAGNITFICVYPFDIAQFSRCHLTLYDTTTVYTGKFRSILNNEKKRLSDVISH